MVRVGSIGLLKMNNAWNGISNFKIWHMLNMLLLRPKENWNSLVGSNKKCWLVESPIEKEKTNSSFFFMNYGFLLTLFMFIYLKKFFNSCFSLFLLFSFSFFFLFFFFSFFFPYKIDLIVFAWPTGPG